MKLVSIIVPCYNQAQYLRDALESVQAQTYQNWECIIVDDGSTDNIRAVVNVFTENDSRFILVEKTNGGVSSARNAGLDKSRGEYILPLDADDEIGKEYLQKGVSILENEPDVKLVYCEAEFFGSQTGRWKLPAFSIEALLLENMIFATAIFRRSDYEKNGGYDHDFNYGWEDWEFWIRILGAEGKVIKLDSVYFFYRKSYDTRNTTLEKNALWRQQMLHLLYAKHRRLYDQFYGGPILAFSDRIKLQQEVQKAQNELQDVYNSREFKISRKLLRPFRLLKWTKK